MFWGLDEILPTKIETETCFGGLGEVLPTKIETETCFGGWMKSFLPR